MVDTQSGMPSITTAAVGAEGKWTTTWYQFLTTLWQRTGQALGTISVILDNIGSTRGDILYRGAAQWSALSPGTAGHLLRTGGAGADPSWTLAGTGTVTSVATGTGLTGGTITTTGTILFANIADQRILANTSGGAAAPVATQMTTLLDIIGSTHGQIVYRGAATWAALGVGSAGQFLQTAGAAANPAWAWPESVTLAITAAGANQAAATGLTTTVNEVTTVAAATGVRLPGVAAGQRFFVLNGGANALNVYPAGAAQIDALGASAAYPVPVGKSQLFWAVSAAQLYSTQLG